MKATELRLGNLVYGINRRSEVHVPSDLPLKVLQIEIFNCEVLPWDKDPSKEMDWLKISNTDLSPIPITPEWLERAGFVKLTRQGCYKWDYNNRFFAYQADDIFSIRIDIFNQDINIQYIHQLQNLYFALTGEELTFKKGGNHE